MKNNIIQTEYFIAINALKRLCSHLIANQIEIPDNIQCFIKSLIPNQIQKQESFKTLKSFIEQ